MKELEAVKEQLTEAIQSLLEQNVRRANIEIELIHHVKKCLKKD